MVRNSVRHVNCPSERTVAERPNAGLQARRVAGARYERRLLAVACRLMSGQVPTEQITLTLFFNDPGKRLPHLKWPTDWCNTRRITMPLGWMRQISTSGHVEEMLENGRPTAKTIAILLPEFRYPKSSARTWDRLPAMRSRSRALPSCRSACSIKPLNTS